MYPVINELLGQSFGITWASFGIIDLYLVENKVVRQSLSSISIDQVNTGIGFLGDTIA